MSIMFPTFSWKSRQVHQKQILPILAQKPEQVPGDLADLDFFRPFGDAVAAVMAVDMLERLVAGVALAAEDLHGSIGGLPDQTVGAVVGHGNLLGHRHVVVLVKIPGGLMNQIADHFGFGMKFG